MASVLQIFNTVALIEKAKMVWEHGEFISTSSFTMDEITLTQMLKDKGFRRFLYPEQLIGFM